MSLFPENEYLWSCQLSPKSTSIIILLPYGTIKVLSCSKDSTLESVKNEIWSRKKTDLQFKKLSQDKNSYIFSGVTEFGKRDEFYDETKRLCDLGLFYGCLKLLQPEGDKNEKILDSNISYALGRPLNELDKSTDPETNRFRMDSIIFVREIVRMREAAPIDLRLNYYYPPELDDYYYLIKLRSENGENKLNSIDKNEKDHFKSTQNKLQSNIDSMSTDIPMYCPNDIIDKLIVRILFMNDDGNRIDRKFEIESKITPNELVELCHKAFDTDSSKRYLIKVCSMDQYFLNEKPILRYKYIVECISNQQIPQLCLTSYDNVVNKLPKTNFVNPIFLKRLFASQKNDRMISDLNPSLWTQTNKTFSVTIHSITYINIAGIDKIYIKAGLFHGSELLCKAINTESVEAQTPKWNEELTFDINMEDLPRSAKLCLTVCGIRKKTATHFAYKWANLQIFDYYGRLRSGRLEVTLFQMPEREYQDFLYPMGNVNAKLLEVLSSINIEFDQNKITFPSMENIFEYAICAKQIEKQGKSYGHKNETKNRHLSSIKMSEEEEKRFNELLMKDQLSVISEEDKDFLWKWRLECCRKNSESLPKLIDSVKWNNRDEVSQLYHLLENWKPIKAETALELLDCKYSDYFVRIYAVKWLDQSITDAQLYQYLLQLVQVLKYEPYFDNELTRFLIRRSLLNRKIGHYFFWHIKSEMNDLSYQIRFSLILEAYCRGIGEDLLNETIRQVDALNKLTKLSQSYKMSKIDNKKKKRFLATHLQQENLSEALKNLRNPLKFSIRLGALEIEKCEILDSSKKPLRLVWNSLDPLVQCNLLSNTIIFKTGDDLRQDMLALQVIEIINSIWKSDGLDLKMVPYTCLATDNKVGMIEVVPNAKTVTKIQKQGGMMAVLQADSTQLNEWIKEKNKTNYDKAVDNFTRSCAGYCVATFILGIGDRNPANIMVREDGRIFHIDFGHFLGHFKRKMGIPREFVPFVLTSDFMYVISKGADCPAKSVEFENFSELCGKAYLSLRKHANLIITLFTMMLYTGMPELQSIEDIEYLRKTLQVEKSDLEAINYFYAKFQEAHGGNWTTKLDWFFHHLAHLGLI